MAALLDAHNRVSFISDQGDVTRCNSLEQAISVIHFLCGRSPSFFRGTVRIRIHILFSIFLFSYPFLEGLFTVRVPNSTQLK